VHTKSYSETNSARRWSVNYLFMVSFIHSFIQNIYFDTCSSFTFYKQSINNFCIKYILVRLQLYKLVIYNLHFQFIFLLQSVSGHWWNFESMVMMLYIIRSVLRCEDPWKVSTLICQTVISYDASIYQHT